MVLDRNQHQRLNLTILTSNCFYFSKEEYGISDTSIYGRADGSSPWAGTETDPHVCAQMTGSLLTQCSALVWLDLNRMPWQCATQQCPDDMITSLLRDAICITNDILKLFLPDMFFVEKTITKLCALQITMYYRMCGCPGMTGSPLIVCLSGSHQSPPTQPNTPITLILSTPMTLS